MLMIWRDALPTIPLQRISLMLLMGRQQSAWSDGQVILLMLWHDAETFMRW
jgi:hypothetical protein